MSQSLDADIYGQVRVPVKWYNVFSWSPAGKFGLYGASIGLASFLAFNRYTRRPYYANALYAVPLTLGVGIFGHLVGRYKEYAARNRDAVIAHYMSLHPEDFTNLNAKGRRWKDVLLPWQPVRYYESPYKWTPDSRAADGDQK